MSFDVLGLGAVAIDDLIYVDAFPPADVKVSILRRDRQCGGLTATALVAAARLGAKCAYAGVLGTDELSEYVLEAMGREGIDVGDVRRREGGRPVHSFIVIDETRHTRNVFSDSRDFAGPDHDWPLEDVIKSSRALLVDQFGLAGMVRAAQIARTARIPVVGDFERNTGARFSELVDLVDHLIVSENFARKYTGTTSTMDALQQLWCSDRKAVVVTRGKEGCIFLSVEQKGVPKHQPSFSVKTLDTTGCGDVFHGAYAVALLDEMTLEGRIEFASAAAALKATQPGGQKGIPTRKMVEEFLESEAREAQRGFGDLTLRAATNRDSEVVSKLVFGILEEFQLCADPECTDSDLRDIEGFYFQRGGFFDVLVTGGGVVVGSVGLLPISKDSCELRKMYLDRALRGRGCGRVLLEHALSRARQLGFSRVVLETASVLKDAIRMYERYGFRPYTPEHKSKRCDIAYALRLQP